MANITLQHTNSNGTRRIPVSDPSGVSILRDDDTPFGKQSLISIPGRGLVWVDGSMSDVRRELRRTTK